MDAAAAAAAVECISVLLPAAVSIASEIGLGNVGLMVVAGGLVVLGVGGLTALPEEPWANDATFVASAVGVGVADLSWRCARDARARFAPRSAKIGVDASSGVGSSIRSTPIPGEGEFCCADKVNADDADFRARVV